MIKRLLLMLCLSWVITVNAQQGDTTIKQNKPIAIRICAPSRASLVGKQPLWVIQMRKHTYVATADTVGSNFFSNPDWVEAINVYKDSLAAARFGSYNFKNGVVEVKIKDSNYTAAHTWMKQLVKEKMFKKVK